MVRGMARVDSWPCGCQQQRPYKLRGRPAQGRRGRRMRVEKSSSSHIQLRRACRSDTVARPIAGMGCK